MIENACSGFDDRGSFDAKTVHKVNVESLKGEFAVVVRMHNVLEMLA